MNNFYLRELAEEDVQEINNWRNDRKIIENLGAPFRYVSKKVDDDWLHSYFQKRSNCVRLAICKADDSRIIGSVYLLNIDWVSRSCEFAIWIGDQDSQGCGAGKYATEKALVHAFSDLNLNRVYLTVLNYNERARGLYKKVGFREEGVQRKAVYKEGNYRDLVMMAILRDEFCPRQ
jgi:RimJ/RimL family protein N-acetyltransferase